MGENYVLGNRDDCNEFKPYNLDPRMFESNSVMMVACGTMHCVVLAKDGSNAK
jgi:alpha-tubulin suppressor-like RCC1 family protein